MVWVTVKNTVGSQLSATVSEGEFRAVGWVATLTNFLAQLFPWTYM